MTKTESFPQPAPLASFPVFDLHNMPATTETGDAFLGRVLDISHHAGWDFWRASGEDLAGEHNNHVRYLVVIVLEGALTLTSDGQETRVDAGDTALIAPGLRFHWKTGGDALWIVNGYACKTSGQAGSTTRTRSITLLDRAARQEPSASPAVHLLRGDTPVCTKLNLAASADAAWSAGLWSATAYERVPVRYGYYELMHIHEGTVSIFDETGHELTFGAGAVFLLPEGVTAGWRSTTPIRKFWSIFTPE